VSPDDGLDRAVKLSRPAHRALVSAGITTFAELARCTQRDIAALHGIGPSAFPELIAAMAARGLAFKP